MTLTTYSSARQPVLSAEPSLTATKREGREAAPGERRLSVVVVDSIRDLADHIPAWEALSASVAEPNVFYEPWMLLPALERFAQGKALVFLLIYATDAQRPNASPSLAGFFPLERKRPYKGLPVRGLCLWQHVHCFLCTPLLHGGYLAECLAAFFAWSEADRGGGALLELPFVPGEGLFCQSLAQRLHHDGHSLCLLDSWPRALLRPGSDAEAYLRVALPPAHRRSLERRGRRLAEAGLLEFSQLEPGGDVEGWLKAFLALEASGWKGRAGTALAANEAERDFFLTVAREAFRRDRLLMLSLRLDGRTLAMRCSFRAGAGAFAFKSAYDELYARYSPGVLLEIENIRRVHADPRVRWMDSCSAPDNAMINGLWRERKTMQTLLLSTGRVSGDFAVAALPLLKWLRRSLLPVSIQGPHTGLKRSTRVNISVSRT